MWPRETEWVTGLAGYEAGLSDTKALLLPTRSLFHPALDSGVFRF